MRRLTAATILLLLLAMASGVLYLGYSVHYGFLGFPLDDAWIHQTYARNLGRHGQLAYNLGEPSVGSTSPLWTALLAPIHAGGLEPGLPTYLLGTTLLFLTGWVSYRLADRLFGKSGWVPLLTGAFCILEWHVSWSAFSGMETILFMLLSLSVMERHLAGARPLVVGLLAGLLTLTRPEGALLLVLVISFSVWRRSWGETQLTWKQLSKVLSLLVAGLAIPVVPYLALNLQVTGNPFPNTFYAKQAEYGHLLTSLPIWARWAQVSFATMIGAQILLLPGVLYSIYTGLSLRRPALILPGAWSLAVVTIYAFRLPVTYQHGRYVMPVIPMLVLLGVWGTKSLPHLHRIVRQVLLISISLLLLIFWCRGAQQYAEDVRIIDSELKTAGVWLADHTPRRAIVGAHDIGAVGYFSERYLVDTAGLITPEVVPFIGDEDGLLAFLKQKEVDYVAAFPSWYPQMTRDPQLSPVYRSTSPWVLAAGGDNVVIYQTAWRLSD
jgi:hypothetical protein